MKQLVILGAGTAGTMMANHLVRKLDKQEWALTIVDEHKTHYYQPGFLFIPFGTYTEQDVCKPKTKFIPKGVTHVDAGIDQVKPDANEVLLKNGNTLPYDILIIATGSKIVPDETQGMLGDGWRRDIFDFYTIEGATALRDRLKEWKGGKLVIHLNEMPIKCPVAPLEFTLLAEAFLTQQGTRDATEIHYLSPLSEAFTKHNCSVVLGGMLTDKKITFVPDFQCERIDAANKKIVSYDEREVEYDLLVTIPTNMGDDCMARSGLGDDLNFVPTDKHTLQSKAHANIFAIGDATNLPSSKAGSVAHFQADVLTENIQRFIAGKPLEPGFDGHANCFIESGYNKAFLIDFNYDVEPVEGAFPLPVVGPFKLLKETWINHMGKLAFRWIYWNMLLKGIPMPGITTKMSLVGKKINKQKGA
ncbi:MAG: NAD(P)/FAD-dependent oxidoreductase [Verrucomicrobia bacterium]|jgi:sulfide:quinone oxidoreductase|nr:NAD(P)/FAD-dependent oxidoreductase [Verrucomicrobiota bacterium]MBT7068521.1 NAD(P)/FAD-dependent oxidoreductase [Verrucomicrobiota bacterium]MBT7701927.1 NAD(P)/FAD-dependent oxidoreductase [Verrucomicrobiota bacterium]